MWSSTIVYRICRVPAVTFALTLPFVVVFQVFWGLSMSARRYVEPQGYLLEVYWYISESRSVTTTYSDTVAALYSFAKLCWREKWTLYHDIPILFYLSHYGYRRAPQKKGFVAGHHLIVSFDRINRINLQGFLWEEIQPTISWPLTCHRQTPARPMAHLHVLNQRNPSHPALFPRCHVDVWDTRPRLAMHKCAWLSEQ